MREAPAGGAIVTRPRAARLGAGVALAALAVAACEPPRPADVEERLFAMGTQVELVIPSADPDSAHTAVRETEAMLRGFERDYHAWADGELARLNRALREGRALEVDPALARLLERAAVLSKHSGGAFDPGIGALVELWGFADAPRAANAPPAPAAIESWLSDRAPLDALTIEGNRVRSSTRALALDLGGIAKGEAVDRVIDIFRDNGIEAGLVNAGGDARALGRRDGRAWRVGIQSPRGKGLLGILELAGGEAAFTSGDYERFYEHDGGRAHHLLDPVTGRPALHTRAVTVVAADGVTADAAATAVFVAGPKRWQQVARAMGVGTVLRVDASGRVEMTPEMRDRLQAPPGGDSSIIDFDLGS